ncbi:MAG TPA: neutral/alkaline non-lysosomal ceramidase N-terminal domain-containing protein [Actinomycetota bacterium]|nr:neutral/alkaline non-lysosomal ceramidase N-terminal domain-containing protein [Actinomycetota bacterium]
MHRRIAMTALIALAALTFIVPVAARSDVVGLVRAGVAVEDITWHPGAGQTGFGERWRPYHDEEQGVEANMYARLMKPSEGVHMRLRTKVMVIDDGEEKVAIVSNDLLGTIQIFHYAVAELIKDDPGISWDNLMIVGSHTESAPSNGSISPLIAAYADIFDEEFFRYVVEKVTDAIRAANANLEPVTFAVGTTQGGNMIQTYVRDNVSLYLDDDLGVARFDRLDGTTMAAFLTYAGHFVLGGNKSRLFSSDGPGYWERMTEREVSARPEQNGRPFVAMYLTGPTGDSDVRGVGQKNLYAEGELKALRLLGPTIDLFENLRPQPDFEVEARAERVAPPADHQVPNFPLLAGAPIPFMVSHRLHVQAVRIGDLLLGGVPGEPVMALGKMLKDQVKDLGLAHPFMLSHANDWTGYIFTPEQYAKQQGRANQGAYGPNQGVFIVGRLVRLVKDMLNTGGIDPPPRYGPLQLIDGPYYETVTALLLASGKATGTARDAAVIPNVVLTCAGLAQPRSVERFGETRFTWRGGNNAVDTPRVELQRFAGDAWETVAVDDSYELQTWLEVYKVRRNNPYLPGTMPGCNELVDHKWSVAFEPAYDFPTGTYRFRSTGVFRTAPTKNEAYESISDPFAVRSSATLAIEDLEVIDGEISFTATYPQSAAQWRYRPSAVTTGSASVTVDGSTAGIATYDADRGRFVLSTPLAGTGATRVELADGYGNTGAAEM